MRKLLHADFVRLWKSRIFWIGIAFTVGIGVLASTTQYREMLSIPGYHPHFDDVLFSNCEFMPIVAAVFIGLFIGTDYSDGTIRNKLIVGHARVAVYASNLIVCTVALFIMHLANIATVVAIGFPLVGNMLMPVQMLLKLGAISMVTVVALSSLFLLMSMLINNKASACVAAVLLSFVMVMGSVVVDNRLREPEYYDAYSLTYTDDTGEQQEVHEEQEKNPNYITGTEREVYTFLYDSIPSCQMLQIAQQTPQHPERLPLYSLAVVAVTTACGVFFFRRKNLV